MVAHKTIFVQPRKREPIIEEKPLIRGVYKEGNAYPVLHFTDVGKELWKTAINFDENASIILVRAEASLDWSVSIKTKDLKILARCGKYKVIGYKPEDCLLTIDFSGEPKAIDSFIQTFASELENENFEFSDWKKFFKFSGISKDEFRNELNKILQKKDEIKSKVIAQTEEKILKTFKCSEIIYKVKVENKGKEQMLDVHIKPNVPAHFSIDREEEIIPKLERGQSEVVVFNILAEKEHEGVEVSSDVFYKDSKSSHIKKLQMKTRYVGKISK